MPTKCVKFRFLTLAKFFVVVQIISNFKCFTIQKMAIKYSGLKAPSYLNNRKMVENLLELNTERLTVPALCLTLQCSGVQAAAEDILREYQAKSKMVSFNMVQKVKGYAGIKYSKR